jgi:hypothetical protein
VQAIWTENTPFLFMRMRGGEHDYMMRSEKRPGQRSGGARPPKRRKRTPKKHPVYAFFTILLLLIAYPVGLVFLWVRKLRWSGVAKLLVSVATGIVFFLLLSFLLTMDTDHSPLQKFQNHARDKLSYVLDATRSAISDKDKIAFNLIENEPRAIRQGTTLALDLAIRHLPEVQKDMKMLAAEGLAVTKSLASYVGHSSSSLLADMGLIQTTPEESPGTTPEIAPESTPETTPAIVDTAPEATEKVARTPAVTTPESTPETTPKELPEATPGAGIAANRSSPDPVPKTSPKATPSVTAKATLEASPGLTPERTPKGTTRIPLEATPAPTPVVTAVRTLEPTPEATLGATVGSAPGLTPERTPETTPELPFQALGEALRSLFTSKAGLPATETPAPRVPRTTIIPETPTPQPTPIQLPEAKSFSDMKVYYFSGKSTFYHMAPNCKGMSNADEHTLAEAVAEGKKPCNTCKPPPPEILEADLAVWCGTDRIFHIDGECPNLTEEWEAMPLLQALMEEAMDGCPLCGADLYEENSKIASVTPVPAPEVF